MATLNVKNVDPNNPVTIESDDGSESVEIAADGQEELGLVLLRSKSFAEKMRQGGLDFVKTQNPGKERYLLARQVMPRLLRALGGDAVELHQRLQSQIRSLESKGRLYNRNWDRADAELQQAKAAKASASHLFKSVDYFLKAKPEQDAVDTIQGELEVLQAEDLQQTGKPFEQWFEEFESKKLELEIAERRLAAAEQTYITAHASLKAALEDASKDFEKVDNGTLGIGNKIPALNP